MQINGRRATRINWAICVAAGSAHDVVCEAQRGGIMAGVAAENEIAQIPESRLFSLSSALILPEDVRSGDRWEINRQPRDRRRIDERANYCQPHLRRLWPAT